MATLREQLDFVYLVYGVAFLTLAVVCLSLSRRDRRLPWGWLSLFGVFHCLTEWLGLIVAGYGDSTPLQFARGAAMTVSFLTLVAFGQIGFLRQKKRGLSVWGLTLLLLLAPLGILAGFNGYAASVRLCLALPGGLLVSAVLILVARTETSRAAFWLRRAGEAMGVFAVLAGVVTPKAAFFPANTMHYQAFTDLVGVPVPIFRCLIVVWLAVSIWQYRRLRTEAVFTGPNQFPGKVWAPLALLVTFLLLGWYTMNRQGQAQGERFRLSLLHRASKLAESIPDGLASRLQYSRADESSASGQLLHQQLARIGALQPEVLDIHLLARRNGKLTAGVGSSPPREANHLSPGDIREDPSGELMDLFESGESLCLGPFQNSGGMMVSAFAPVRDVQSGHVVALLEVDIRADEWMAAIARARMVPALFVLVLCGLLLAEFHILARRREAALARPRWLDGVEAAVVVLVGLVVTGYVTYLTWDGEREEQAGAFRRMAGFQTAGFRQECILLGDTLEAAARIVSAARSGSSAPLLDPAGSLLRGRQGVAGFAWIPLSGGGADSSVPRPFHIQPDTLYWPSGQNSPVDWAKVRAEVAGRGMKRAIGPGWGTEGPSGRGGNWGAYLLIQPVPDSTPAAHQFVGTEQDTALAALFDVQWSLQKTLTRNMADAMEVGISIMDMEKGGMVVASSPLFDDLPPPPTVMECMTASGSLLLQEPFFLFDHVCMIVSRPRKGFLETHPIGTYQLVFVTGCLVSLLLSGFILHLQGGRRRAERMARKLTADLEESEQRLSFALELSSDGLWDWDLVSGAAYYNPQWAISFGLPVAEVFPRIECWRGRIHPDDLPAADRALEDHIGGAEPLFCFEGRLRDGSGAFRNILSRGKVVERDAEGRARRMVGTDSDITGRKSVENALRESRDRLELVLQNSDLGLWDWDLSRAEVRFNEKLRAMAGFPEGTTSFTSGIRSQLLHPEDVERVIRIVERHLHGELPSYETEYRLLRKDGTALWVLERGRTVEWDSCGRPLRLTGTLLDITSRRETEDAVRQSEARFREIAECAPFPIFVTTLEGDVVFANERAFEAFGAPHDMPLENLNTTEFYTDPSARVAIVQNLLKDGIVRDRDIHVRSLTGRTFWFRVSATLGDFAGRRSILVSCNDVSDLVQAETDLRRAKEAWEQACRVRDRFLASMSHEIRNPLNGVIGMTDHLLGTRLSREQREYAGIARTCASGLLGMLNDILDYARGEAGGLRREPVLFDIRELVEESLEAHALVAHQKGLELTGLVDSALPDFWVGDSRRIRQVLLNLVGNAIKFSDQGNVALCAESGKPGHVRFMVTDEGPGIPEENHPDLFLPFFQLDVPDSGHGGVGLGLAICRQLVEFMGGEIGVKSRLGEGACFWFEIPLEEARGQSEPHVPLLTGRRMLVLGASAGLGRQLGTTLESWGARCEVVSDMSSAKEAIRQGMDGADPVGVILAARDCDPGVSGIPLIRLLPLGETPSSGEKYWVFLPVRRRDLAGVLSSLEGDQTAVPEEKPVRDVSGRGLRRVLVVDDEAVSRRVAQMMLTHMGVEADLAGSGGEALELASRNRYDLALLDLQMPGQDGYEVLAALRGVEGCSVRELPVAAMTGASSQEEKNRCLASGMIAVLSKPIQIGELQNLLECCFRGPGTLEGMPGGDSSRT